LVLLLIIDNQLFDSRGVSIILQVSDSYGEIGIVDVEKGSIECRVHDNEVVTFPSTYLE